jgi:hypothetical protein
MLYTSYMNFIQIRLAVHFNIFKELFIRQTNILEVFWKQSDQESTWV